MGLHDKLELAIANRDMDAFLNLLHEDFTVTFHKSAKFFLKRRVGIYGYRHVGQRRIHS